METNIEQLIISALVRSTKFRQQTAPYIKKEYFQNPAEKKLFEIVWDHIQKFGDGPNKTQLMLEAKSENWSNWDDTKEIIDGVWNQEIPNDIEWLLDKAEQFCQGQAIYNAIMKSIAIYEGEEKSLKPMAIPDLLRDAVAVSFDDNIGMDLFDDVDARWEYFNNPEYRVPFKLSALNMITSGGIPTKTLNIAVAGTNVGKSMVLISLAADYIRDGHDVFYISMEMREEEIFRRVDANLLGCTIAEVSSYDKDKYKNRLDLLKKRSYGSLKVKAYPPGSANSTHFQHIIRELGIKKSFKPKIVIVDYLGIIDSSRIKVGTQGSYFYLKAASEELRALAVENDFVLWTAVQINREGLRSSDFELSDIAESAGIAHTADLMLGIIRTEELDESGQLLIKQLKNRYANKTTNSRFTVGVNLEMQKLFDISESSQADIVVPEDVVKKLSSNNIKDRFKSLNGG